MEDGKAIIFSAPSGSGKTTIVRHLLRKFNNLAFSISATTRPRRIEREVEGRDYYFLSINEFKKKIEKGDFIEWEEVYDGNYYGTLKSEVDRLWSIGKHVLFDVDVKGGIKLNNYFKEKCLAIFVKVKDMEELEARLRHRNTETEENIRKRLAKSIKPKGFGVILRTVAEGKKVAELDKDLQNSLDRWKTMCKRIANTNTPTKILSELNRASSILRDVMNDSFTSIVTNDETLKLEIKEYLQEIYPEKENIVKLHRSKTPIFEKYGIERQIKTSFGKTVSMSRGAYLVIEHTEALHVIDVNSGNRSNKAGSQEETALEVNLIAATEIARQLQLRDMGGIIVVDFIDMHSPENRNKLYQHLKEQMAFDRTKHKILPPSKFGLVQITRQRVRPELSIKTTEPNPNVNGEVEAPIVLIDKIEVELNRILSNPKNTKIELNVHSFVAAYLTKGLFSIQFRWYRKYKKWINIIPRDAYRYLQYKFNVRK